MFKILHKPTGMRVKKPSAMWHASSIINRALSSNDTVLLRDALTDGGGHTYNTRAGAEKFLRRIVEGTFRDQFEIEEYKKESK